MESGHGAQTRNQNLKQRHDEIIPSSSHQPSTGLKLAARRRSKSQGGNWARVPEDQTRTRDSSQLANPCGGRDLDGTIWQRSGQKVSDLFLLGWSRG